MQSGGERCPLMKSAGRPHPWTAFAPLSFGSYHINRIIHIVSFVPFDKARPVRTFYDAPSRCSLDSAGHCHRWPNSLRAPRAAGSCVGSSS